MASESWEDQAVVVEPPEIKLFGQWSAQDVQVGDISLTVSIPVGSVLARNEEFSKIAVINFFLVLKKKIQLSVGGILRGKFRDIPRKSTV